jgi:hypothetical protein
MAETAAGKEMEARAAARKAKAEKAKRHVWCAYDGAGVYVLFGEERAALRFAVEHKMGCKSVVFGVALAEQI